MNWRRIDSSSSFIDPETSRHSITSRLSVARSRTWSLSGRIASTAAAMPATDRTRQLGADQHPIAPAQPGEHRRRPGAVDVGDRRRRHATARRGDGASATTARRRRLRPRPQRPGRATGCGTPAPTITHDAPVRVERRSSPPATTALAMPSAAHGSLSGSSSNCGCSYVRTAAATVPSPAVSRACADIDVAPAVPASAANRRSVRLSSWCSARGVMSCVEQLAARGRRGGRGSACATRRSVAPRHGSEPPGAARAPTPDAATAGGDGDNAGDQPAGTEPAGS